MNQSVDPCQDFYAYSCGGWQQRNPLEDVDENYSVWSKVRGQKLVVLKKALEKASVNYSQVRN